MRELRRFSGMSGRKRTIMHRQLIVEMASANHLRSELHNSPTGSPNTNSLMMSSVSQLQVLARSTGAPQASTVGSLRGAPSSSPEPQPQPRTSKKAAICARILLCVCGCRRACQPRNFAWTLHLNLVGSFSTLVIKFGVRRLTLSPPYLSSLRTGAGLL